MLSATLFRWWSLGWMEVAGFVTGAVSVWLTVRENIWLWPVGIANNVLFFVLFWAGRLYADAGLQVVYLALSVYGWWNWLYGGANRTELRISRAQSFDRAVVACAIPVATLALRELLIVVHDAAPFWDALTTVVSLAAQYLLTRKRFENWFLWMAADVVYVPLYFSRALPLIAVLYLGFLLMCVAGVLEWRKALRVAGPANAR